MKSEEAGGRKAVKEAVKEAGSLKMVARRPWGLARRLGEFARGWLGKITGG